MINTADSPAARAIQPASDEQGTHIAFNYDTTGTRTVAATWWPRSRSLVKELPELIVALREHGDRMTRLSYNPERWDTAPNRIAADGRVIRLGWFASLDPSVLVLSGIDSDRRITVSVVEPDLTESAAGAGPVNDGPTHGG